MTPLSLNIIAEVDNPAQTYLMLTPATGDQISVRITVEDILDGVAAQSTAMPQVTTAERLALTPTLGQEVYDTDGAVFLRYNGARWIEPGAVPIGSVQPWDNSTPNTPVLPWGWELCDGHECTDAESPYNGQTLYDLNGEGRFLGAADTAGGTASSQNKTHYHVNTPPAKSVTLGNHQHYNTPGQASSYVGSHQHYNTPARAYLGGGFALNWGGSNQVGFIGGGSWKNVTAWVDVTGYWNSYAGAHTVYITTPAYWSGSAGAQTISVQLDQYNSGDSGAARVLPETFYVLMIRRVK